MAKKLLDNTNLPYFTTALSTALKDYADSGDLPNLLSLSDMEQSDMSYALGWYPTYATLDSTKTYTVTMLATVGTKDTEIGVYADGGASQKSIGNYTKAMSGTIQSFTFQPPANTCQISFFHRPNDSDFDSSTVVHWAVLTEGTRGARGWRPAPDDLRPIRHEISLSSISSRDFRKIKVGDWVYVSSRVQGPVISRTDTSFRMFRTYDKALITYTRSGSTLTAGTATAMASTEDVDNAIKDRWVEIPELSDTVNALSGSGGTCHEMASSTSGFGNLLIKMRDDGDFTDNFPCRNLAGIFITRAGKAWYFPFMSVDVESTGNKEYVYNFGPCLVNNKLWRIEIGFNQGDSLLSVCTYAC